VNPDSDKKVQRINEIIELDGGSGWVYSFIPVIRFTLFLLCFIMENVNIPILSYADTSVFGGVFDDGFDEASKAFFQQVKEKRFKLVISPIVQKEIELAPENVRQFFDEITESANFIAIYEEALLLRQAYLDAGIVTPKSTADALHVALATVAKCQLIVSWNFKHIVHFQKVPLYRAINTIKGYNEINIYSPPEVINYESETI